MAAGFVVRTVSPIGKGHDVLFFIEYKAEWYFFELIPFIVIGMLGVRGKVILLIVESLLPRFTIFVETKGLFGLYFIKLNIKWCRIRKTTLLGKYPITEVSHTCMFGVKSSNWLFSFCRVGAGDNVADCHHRIL